MPGAEPVGAGVWRIELPTPWPVGPVNAYLIEDDPLTLLDTGPRSPEARAALQAGLADRGRRVADLERIVLSHQHVDHWGLAAELVARSGAEVCALAPLHGWLGRYPASLEAEEAYARELLVHHGVPVAPAAGAVYRAELGFGEPVAVTRRLHDGERLGFAGRELRVGHRPGHSASDTVFLDEARGVMFAADHLLRRPSTPILAPPLDGSPPTARPRALADQLASLRATDALALDHVLPGHGRGFGAPGAAIARHAGRYRRMTEAVRDALDDGGPRQAIDLARRTRGRLADRAPFFALCDVLGCLDLLVGAGEVTETLRGAGAWFERT